jgi:hypothetical protein
MVRVVICNARLTRRAIFCPDGVEVPAGKSPFSFTLSGINHLSNK